MTEDDLLDLLDPLLEKLGFAPDDGEEFRSPSLDILKYYKRPARLHALPVFGSGWSIVAVARQPVDIGGTALDYTRLVERVAAAAHGRFPPWPRGRGLVIGLSLIVLTPEPINSDDDALLGRVLTDTRRRRVLPLALFRINLGQEVIALALRDPSVYFPEVKTLADDLTSRFQRLLPLFTF